MCPARKNSVTNDSADGLVCRQLNDSLLSLYPHTPPHMHMSPHLPPHLALGPRLQHLIFFRDGVSEGQFKEVYYVSRG